MARARYLSSRPAARVLAIAGGALLAGCAANLSGPARFYGSATAIGDVAVPVASFAERRFLTVIRQRYDFSCGSAALATLMRYHYNEPIDEEQAFIGMWRDGDRAAIRRVGFSLLDMKRFLAARGIAADGFKVSLDQIAKTGVPGITLVTINGYRHFVVVKGIDADGRVLVGDPALGLRTMTSREFQSVWNGVYFVLNDRVETGKAAFNGPSQWAAYARAPVGTRFTHPLSVQELSLTAPLVLGGPLIREF